MKYIILMHVRSHTGVDGNEQADKLAEKGSRLRFELMEGEAPEGWFQDALKRYWDNTVDVRNNTYTNILIELY